MFGYCPVGAERITVFNFSRCFTAAELLHYGGVLVLTLICIIALMFVVNLLEAAWMRRTIRNQKRTIAAMAMAEKL